MFAVCRNHCYAAQSHEAAVLTETQCNPTERAFADTHLLPFGKYESGGISCSSTIWIVVLRLPVQLFHIVRWLRHGKVTDLQHCGKAELYFIPRLLETPPDLLSGPPAKIPTDILHIPSSSATTWACQTCVQPRLSNRENNTPMKEHSIAAERFHSKCGNTEHSVQGESSHSQGCFSNTIRFYRRSASRAPATSLPLWQKHGRETLPRNTGNLYQASSAIILWRPVNIACFLRV